jgi:hypothetical protein
MDGRRNPLQDASEGLGLGSAIPDASGLGRHHLVAGNHFFEEVPDAVCVLGAHNQVNLWTGLEELLPLLKE